jgi:hypothetical protein
MGWTYTHRERGLSHLEFFRPSFDFDGESGPRRLVALTSRGMTLYGAYSGPFGKDGAQATVGLVILTQWVPNSEYNYGYKEMDESMGPGYYDCPASILTMLTPHDGSESAYARDWRAECWKALNARINRPRLTKGTRVRFARPMRFTDGTEGDTFEFVKRSTFRKIVPLDFTPQEGEPWFYGGLVRISGWAQREYVTL